MRNFRFLLFSFFRNTFKVQRLYKIRRLNRKKSHQNLSDYDQFLFKKRFEVNKKQIFSSEKMRNSENCIYDYAHSFVGEEYVFFMIQNIFWILYLFWKEKMCQQFSKSYNFQLQKHISFSGKLENQCFSSQTSFFVIVNIFWTFHHFCSKFSTIFFWTATYGNKNQYFFFRKPIIFDSDHFRKKKKHLIQK